MPYTHGNYIKSRCLKRHVLSLNALQITSFGTVKVLIYVFGRYRALKFVLANTECKTPIVLAM